jgi:hypothetical protein
MKECSLYQGRMIDAALGRLDAPAMTELEAHLSSCPACGEEMAGIRQVFMLMEEKKVPAPSPEKRQRFQEMLIAYKQSESTRWRWSLWLEQLWDNFRAKELSMPLVLGMMLGVLGMGVAALLLAGNSQHAELKILAAEVHALKQDRVLSLLDNPAAAERIRGVSYSLELKDAGRNRQIIRALLTTLNNDPNVNVRLTALETLADHFAGEETVREGLVKAIVLQDSPMVQAAMADVMLRLQEKSAVPALKKLLKEKELEEPVRRKITQAVSKLI